MKNSGDKIKMIKLLILAIFLLTFCTFGFGQTPSESIPAGAREVMLKFVELNNKKLLQTEEARQIFGGESLEWKFDCFEQNLSHPDKILSMEKNYSVARVQILEKKSRVVDLYFYLRFDAGIWKISSMRAMAQTGLTESAVKYLKSKTDLTADEKETLANAELTLSSDKMLTEWFQKNRSALDNFAALALVETKPKPVKITPKPKIKKSGAAKNSDSIALTANPLKQDEINNNEPRTIERITANTPKFPKTSAALKNLHIAALETKADSSVEFTIGGITDNTVGFIYSPKDAPPKIDGWRYIWIEKIAAGWYLFRTT